MITPSTTIAELAEVLRRNGLVIIYAEVDGDVCSVAVASESGDAWEATHDTLAAAISAALAKAGAR